MLSVRTVVLAAVVLCTCLASNSKDGSNNTGGSENRGVPGPRSRNVLSLQSANDSADNSDDDEDALQQAIALSLLGSGGNADNSSLPPAVLHASSFDSEPRDQTPLVTSTPSVAGLGTHPSHGNLAMHGDAYMPAGIRNAGDQLCYIASMIQVLFHVPRVRASMYTMFEQHGGGGPVMDAMASVFARLAMARTADAPVNLHKDLLRTISARSTADFELYNRDDPYAFFLWLMRMLPGLPLDAVSAAASEALMIDHPSQHILPELNRLFGTMYEVQTIRDGRPVSDVRTESGMGFTAAVLQDRTRTVDELLIESYSIIDAGPNARRTRLVTTEAALPKVLVIQADKFRPQGDGTFFYDSRVPAYYRTVFPAGDRMRYRLVGMVMYRSGHFVARVRTHGDTWWLLDDTRASLDTPPEDHMPPGRANTRAEEYGSISGEIYMTATHSGSTVGRDRRALSSGYDPYIFVYVLEDASVADDVVLTSSLTSHVGAAVPTGPASWEEVPAALRTVALVNEQRSVDTHLQGNDASKLTKAVETVKREFIYVNQSIEDLCSLIEAQNLLIADYARRVADDSDAATREAPFRRRMLARLNEELRVMKANLLGQLRAYAHLRYAIGILAGRKETTVDHPFTCADYAEQLTIIHRADERRNTLDMSGALTQEEHNSYMLTVDTAELQMSTGLEIMSLEDFVDATLLDDGRVPPSQRPVVQALLAENPDADAELRAIGRAKAHPCSTDSNLKSEK